MANSALLSLSSRPAGDEAGAGQEDVCNLGIRIDRIRIDRKGTWYYRDSPILHQDMVRLFASMLTRRSDGSYWLVASGETGAIGVEDVPFLAVAMVRRGAGHDEEVLFRTNLDELVRVDADHPLREGGDPIRGEPVLYVTVSQGIEARLSPSVYDEFLAYCSGSAVGVLERLQAPGTPERVDAFFSARGKAAKRPVAGSTF